MSHKESFAERRPWLLWTLSLLVALTGAANLWLAGDHVLHAGHYRDLGVSYPPLLRAACALAWGAALITFGAGMAWRRQWARRWILVLLSNYGVFGVLWMVVFAASDFGRGRIAFQAVLTVALLAVCAWVLRRRRIRIRFEP